MKWLGLVGMVTVWSRLSRIHVTQRHFHTFTVTWKYGNTWFSKIISLAKYFREYLRPLLQKVALLEEFDLKCVKWFFRLNLKHSQKPTQKLTLAIWLRVRVTGESHITTVTPAY